MIKLIKMILWLLILAITALGWEAEAQAAPGDSLFQWGLPHQLATAR